MKVIINSRLTGETCLKMPHPEKANISKNQICADFDEKFKKRYKMSNYCTIGY